MERKRTKRPKIRLRPDQVDFSNVRWAPVINCVVKHKSKILLVKRSREINFYPSYWNGISGFLDDSKSLKEKVQTELKEELGIPKTEIKKIFLGEVFHQEELKYKKTWIVHPVLVEVETDKIKLNWEAEDYKWATFKEVQRMKLLPGFDRVLENISSFIKNNKKRRKS